MPFEWLFKLGVELAYNFTKAIFHKEDTINFLTLSHHDPPTLMSLQLQIASKCLEIRILNSIQHSSIQRSQETDTLLDK
jgi:hypothetical protein